MFVGPYQPVIFNEGQADLESRLNTGMSWIVLWLAGVICHFEYAYYVPDPPSTLNP